jgi:hypothetical protein
MRTRGLRGLNYDKARRNEKREWRKGSRIRGLTRLNMGRDEMGPHDTEAGVETENTESWVQT